MAVSAVSNASRASFFQTAGKIGAIGGTVASAACVVLGQDYTYPCAIAVIGACAWFSVRINQSIPQEALSPKAQEKTLKEQCKDVAHELVDELGDKFKAPLKVSTDKLVDASVTTGKLAAITSLPPGVGALAGASLAIAGGIIKGLSARSVESSTDSTKSLVKRSVDRSFT